MVKENNLIFVSPAVKEVAREAGVASTTLFLIIVSKPAIAVISILRLLCLYVRPF
jgi:hypothetical protein